MSNSLQNEFDYYLANQDEIVKKHLGKYVVIKGDKVIGVYENELDAIESSQKEHELGTFLVQFVSPGDSSYTQVFHSRVSFS